jgi:methionine-rich copper-binding protein CopC
VAAAHAILEASDPPIRGQAQAGTVRFHLRFNSRIDRARSVLTLTRPDRTRVTLPIQRDSPPAILDATADLTPGDYVLRWQVLAVDGHITRGDIPFTVTEH